ncbi:UvrD-helicase domain-containing protein [Candidatus Blastococcus massiliensis]|uniref:UvrD-helicase domain-containing protein n=1 Tax=Candidatus Blastococcus massiliensis TaxID=1470358 RepID=UPI00058ED071|nr:ATP-dependent helicase [Candidatus Blastococcus massiliensis]
MRVAPSAWRPRDIEDLEPAAWDALRAGTASITAGPGAGKSEFLAQRASYLLETGLCRPPRQILAISFKRDAAINLRRRVRARLPDHAARFTSMTFDAFTKSIVDRFKGLLPPAWALDGSYRIGFASQAEVRDFLGNLALSGPQRFRADLHNIRRESFVADLVGSKELEAEPREPTTAEDYAVQQWWLQKYQIHDVPAVDFVLLNRLADLIIRSSPQLQRALVATYPHVFIDEFQDTTYAQYSFLRSIFGRDGTTVTVVGDRKQRIMGWAGALTDAFAQFEHDFRAESFELTWNFRSTRELVELQHRFATRLDPGSQQQLSQVVSRVGERPVQIWSFSNARLEAESVAAWIAADIEQFGRAPADYALLARQRVTDLEPQLAQALAAQGLRLRNDDAQIGDLRLQDLLKDELAQLLIGLIRLGAVRGGQPQTWRAVTATLGRVAPRDRNREVGSSVDDALSHFLLELRSWFAATPLNDVPAESVIDITEALVDKLATFVKYDNIAHKRVLAERPEDLAVTLRAFKIRLADVLGRVPAWNNVADAFTDGDAVPLLTIHRSKGLEYHTVFFIGLDGDQWWAHARDTVESTMTFFVGVSRAAERLIFTQCDERGPTDRIADLYEVLNQAEVPVLRMG